MRSLRTEPRRSLFISLPKPNRELWNYGLCVCTRHRHESCNLVCVEGGLIFAPPATAPKTWFCPFRNTPGTDNRLTCPPDIRCEKGYKDGGRVNRPRPASTCVGFRSRIPIPIGWERGTQIINPHGSERVADPSWLRCRAGPSRVTHGGHQVADFGLRAPAGGLGWLSGGQQLSTQHLGQSDTPGTPGTTWHSVVTDRGTPYC